MKKLSKFLGFALSAVMMVGAAVFNKGSFESVLAATPTKSYTLGSSMPTDWECSRATGHASGYLKLQTGDYVKGNLKNIFPSGEFLDSDMSVVVSCATFGTWSGTKSATITASFLDSSGNVLSNNSSTYNNLSSSEGDKKSAINISKPSNVRIIDSLKIEISGVKSGDVLRFKYVDLTYTTSVYQGPTDSAHEDFEMLNTRASLSFSYSYSETEFEYRRVTNKDMILAGGEFVLGYEATAKSNVIVPMRNEGTATTSANGYLYSGTVSGSSGNTTVNPTLDTFDATNYTFTIEPSTTEDSVYLKLGANYVGNTDSKNNLKLFSTKSANTLFKVAIATNDVVTLTIVANSSYNTLQYNSSSGSERFAVYGGTQKNLVLFKKAAKISVNNVSIRFGVKSGEFTSALNTKLVTEANGSSVVYGVKSAACAKNSFNFDSAKDTICTLGSSNDNFALVIKGVPSEQWSTVISAQAYVKIGSNFYKTASIRSTSVKLLAEEYLTSEATKNDSDVLAAKDALAFLAK